MGEPDRDSDNGDVTKRICHVCKDLGESLPLQQGLPLRIILQQSATGCSTCQIISEAVLAVGDDEDELGDLVIGWDMMRIEGCRVVVGSADTGQFVYGIDVYSTLTNQQVPWRAARHSEQALEVSGDTSSDAAMKTIQHWMNTCSRDHSCQPQLDSILPTRLLDVTNPERVFLYSSKPDEKGIYACLSHCWGTSQTLRTTTSNIHEHENGIPRDELPTVFQDAITVVSRLDIRYLWIDSLCIIQDSAQDWQSQSVKMADIYANGTITIAASLASGDDERLYATTPDLHISRPIETNTFRSINARRTLKHGHGDQPLPLMRRAWVLQERLLSPRVVHFTHEELIWECMEKTACECGCIRSLWSPGHVPFDKDLLFDQVLANASRGDVRTRWRSLVEEYSRLELTFDRDRLPAVSGAARKFSTTLTSRYLAGLWVNSLISDLLWERKTLSKPPRRLATLPSWSWASLGTEVLYDRFRAEENLAVVLEASCSLLDPNDEFGEVLGGTIHISAVLLPISVPEASQHGPVPVSRLDTATSSAYTGQLILDDPDEGARDSLFCARMAWRHEVYSEGSGQSVWLALACVDAMDQTYRRVGLLKTDSVDWDEDSLPEPQFFTII